MRDVANTSAEVVLKRFDEQHNKYKFMEANLRQKKQRWATHNLECGDTVSFCGVLVCVCDLIAG